MPVMDDQTNFHDWPRYVLDHKDSSPSSQTHQLLHVLYPSNNCFRF